MRMEPGVAGRPEAADRLAIAIVVPVFNEAAGLASFHASLKEVLASLPHRAHILYVNDGSTDRTLQVLAEIQAHDKAVAYLTLSRNFGHQAALTAGLESADADVVIMMDGDGQHPPSLIPDMIRLYQQGFDIVQSRREEADGSAGGRVIKRWTSRIFYTCISSIGEVHLPPGAADFRLISRDVLHVLHQMQEYHRFIRGMTTWLGFRTAMLPYQPAPRGAGSTKYSVRKMARLAADGFFSFSLVPVRLGIAAGCLFLVLAVVEVLYVVSFWLRKPDALVPGWSSIILMVTLGNAVTMILLGLIGIYVGMIFQEVKRRPVYVISPAQSSPAALRPRDQDHPDEADQRQRART